MLESLVVLPALIVSMAFGFVACSSPVPESVTEDGLEPLPTAWPPADAAGVRSQLLKELRTVTLKNCTLKRYGGPNDGGYLMCQNLASGVQSAYSYGIDTEDVWGCDVSRELKVPIHQYDCFTTFRPACSGGTFVFHNECVGPKQETKDARAFDTISSQIAKNGDAGKTVLMKIDIEGAEWDSLMATPDEVLDTFLQMPMELHGVDEAKFVEIVRRLKRKFYLVNLHFNNHACDAASAPLPAWAMQVLWVNKKVGVRDRNGPSPAPVSLLNAPDNVSVPDCQLPAAAVSH
jgi:hypothetical protein